MNYIFLDANIYLKFYLGNQLAKVLDNIFDNKDNILITKQIKDEVIRNSVSSTANVLQNSLKDTNWRKPTIPYKTQEKNLVTEIKDLSERVKRIVEKVEAEFKVHLENISMREDDISKKLDLLFSNAIIPTEEEILESKNVKAFGNPPGKKADPIGDELSWLQIKNFLSPNDKLVIVTNDRDYATQFNKLLILNSSLSNDLKEKNIEYYVYSEAIDGLKKLKELQEKDNLSFDNTEFPNISEQEEISIEEQKIHIDIEGLKCSHPKAIKLLNGIYEEYRCLYCNTLLNRYYNDDVID